MKRKLFLMVLALIVVLLLAGCGCEHEWVDANCVNPKTCSLCEETEGAPLGHSWVAATCANPKSCENCDATEGEALGHTWEDATCIIPKKCATCHETEGEPLSHDWEEATTEAPKTCRNCQETEGEKLQTDPRFTTASTKHLQGLWSCEVVLTGDMMGTTGYLDEVPCTLFYEFGNTGELNATVEIHDRLAFMEGLRKMTMDVTYASLAQQGIGKAAADEAMLATYDMTMEEYVNATVDAIDLDAFFGYLTADMVYYVGENMIYASDTWYNEFTGSNYTLENDVLIIEDDVLEEGGEPLQWKRVEEDN